MTSLAPRKSEHQPSPSEFVADDSVPLTPWIRKREWALNRMWYAFAGLAFQWLPKFACVKNVYAIWLKKNPGWKISAPPSPDYITNSIHRWWCIYYCLMRTTWRAKQKPEQERTASEKCVSPFDALFGALDVDWFCGRSLTAIVAHKIVWQISYSKASAMQLAQLYGVPTYFSDNSFSHTGARYTYSHTYTSL